MNSKASIERNRVVIIIVIIIISKTVREAVLKLEKEHIVRQRVEVNQLGAKNAKLEVFFISREGLELCKLDLEECYAVGNN